MLLMLIEKFLEMDALHHSSLFQITYLYLNKTYLNIINKDLFTYIVKY